jgi:hypothetical protein
MIIVIKLFFILNILFIISTAYAYQLDQPSKPNSKVSWWLDHQTKQDYQKYYDNKKKQEELKKEEYLKRVKSDTSKTTPSTKPTMTKTLSPTP